MEKAKSDGRAEQLRIAPELRDGLTEILHDDALIAADYGPTREEVDEMARRRDDLEEVISSLRASDPAVELARFQALAPSYVQGMRRKPRAERPEWMLKYM